MEFDNNAQLDATQVDDMRSSGGASYSGASTGGMGGMGGGGGGGGMGLPRVGGGLGLLLTIGILLFKMFAGGGGATSGLQQLPSSPGGGQIQAPAGDNSKLAENCKTGADANTKQDCALLASINSVQKFWTAEFPRQNLQYQPAKTRFFRDQVSTGCGPAESAMGPFYCPADQYVYLDQGFFDEFKTKFGASAGTFAQAYVLAHEYGHHVQDLLGTSAQVERAGNKTGPESASVRLELQADCYAGVWANHAVGDGFIKNLTDADIADGIDAATKVGDDYIQKKFQGRVNRESWTHGSSAQRVNWFQNGLTRGNMNDCDTFSGGI
jgi:uncharacterized protein